VINELRRTQAKVQVTQGPRVVTNFLLSVVVLTMVFADYWAYSVAHRAEPDIYLDLLNGTAFAPAQYRVGVVLAAHFLAHTLRYGLTFIDLVSGFVAVFGLLSLLRRSEVYQKAGVAGQWFASAAFILLVQFYFAWVVWYQRPETLPNSALIVLVLLLLTRRFPVANAGGQVLTAVCMLALAAIQGFVRADVAVALHLGVLLVCLTRAGAGMALPRTAQAVTSVLAILLAGGIQYYLMRVVYPQANYGDTPPFQLILNFTDHSEAPTFLLFIVPYAWTVWILLRKMRDLVRGADGALLAGSAVFLGMWFMLGRIQEVRIFLPFALAVSPITVKLAVLRFLPKDCA
jgi:hypothetical protein